MPVGAHSLREGDDIGRDSLGVVPKWALERSPRVGTGVQQHNRDTGLLTLLPIGEPQPGGQTG